MFSFLVAAALSSCGGGGMITAADVATASASMTASADDLASCFKSYPSNFVDASAPLPTRAPAPVGVSLLNYGARCDGVTDDTAAINRGIADAKSRSVPLLIPSGQCNFSSVVRLDGAKITGVGPASVLYATNWDASAIFMSGAAPSISRLKLAGVAAPARQDPWETCRIVVFGATGFVIDQVTIEGAAGAGIHLTKGASGGQLTGNVVRNTLADAIHMTDGTTQVLLDGNLIENAGDDGIAVVSYQSDGRLVNNITARNNVVRNNRGGRNMSVVGGSKVLYENNLMEGNLAGFACLYIAQEDSYQTYAAVDVTASRNTLHNCGSAASGHAAAMVFSDGTQPIANITLLANDIVQGGQDGIRYFGPQTNTRFQENRITGARRTYVGRIDASVAIVPYTGGAVGYIAP